MDKTVDYAYFTRKMFIHSVLPAPLAGIGLALAEIGDTILVGHAIGMDGLAAIGFISPLFLLAAFLVFGLSMGGAVVYSNLMHEGKKEEALGIFNFFMRISASCWLFWAPIRMTARCTRWRKAISFISCWAFRLRF